MLSLLKKDLWWMAVFACVGAIAPVTVAFDRGIVNVLVNPEHRTITELGIALWIPAALLGAFAALREDLTRTRPYLLHRAVSPRRVFWTRALGCALVIVAWVAVPVVLLGVRDLVAGAGLAAVGTAALAPLAAVTLQALASFAAAAFALSLPTRWPVRLLMVVMSSVTVHLAAAALSDNPWLVGHPARVAVGMAVIGGIFLVSAARHEAITPDPDRPVPLSILMMSGAVAFGCLSFVAPAMVTGIQQDLLEMVRAQRPHVVRLVRSEGRLSLAGAPEHRGDWSRPLLDAELGKVGTTQGVGDDDVLRNLGPGLRMPNVLSPRLTPDRWFSSFRHPGGMGYLRVLGDSRGVEVLTMTWNPSTRRAVVLERGDGETFSARLCRGELAGSMEEPELFLGDPEDGSLWKLILQPGARLEPLELPDGDRFDGFDVHLIDKRSETVVRGRTGAWRWQGGRFVAGPAVQATRIGGAHLTQEVVDPDILTPEVVVRSIDGHSLRHRFHLVGFAPRLQGGATLAMAIVRPPVSALAGLVCCDSSILGHDGLAWTVDPLVVTGRGWLAGASLLLHALLALAVFRGLRRIGVSFRRAMVWSVAVGLGGFLVGLLVAGIETRRAHRCPPAARPPAPLIRSA